MRARRGLHVLSVYEGFFSGGARILHSEVVRGLQEGDQHHRVLSIHGEVHREATRQRMEDDACYRSLTAAGVGVTSLGRVFPASGDQATFTGPELADTARATADADVILSSRSSRCACSTRRACRAARSSSACTAPIRRTRGRPSAN